jgi:hypothetical protein
VLVDSSMKEDEGPTAACLVVDRGSCRDRDADQATAESRSSVSFMPNPGTRVRLRDGRAATVTKVSQDGRNDHVRFDDGHEERVVARDLEDVK